MKRVGLRELKNRLSEYVRLVRAGETVLVTDRGEVVAELRPPGDGPLAATGLPAGLVGLARRGVLTIASGHTPGVYRPQPPALAPGELLRFLDEERGDR